MNVDNENQHSSSRSLSVSSTFDSFEAIFSEPMSKAYCSRAAQDAEFGPVLQI